ncbi:energy transducer TonB [Dysgonomonas sp. ZJ709]|uniref:energy transducer TonB n=1 Tax=Dysgonomonas sp. ZJ709 TaxID=2709797 RepID=UPI0013ECFE30|nr:energy transducer TonB [Dysgonomonas sp. ZJ709]
MRIFKTTLLILLTTLAINLNAQNEIIINKALEIQCEEDSNEESTEEKPYVFVEQMPSFVGAEMAMVEFIHTNLVYPEEALKEGVQGRIVIRFVVTRDGDLTGITVLRGIGHGCDEEAVRIVESMPRWTPGSQNGVAVPVYYTLIVPFRLPAKDTGVAD